METLIITIIFIALFITTPWIIKNYLKLDISILQWGLISFSGICTFITAGIFMGEPLPPFPEWGIQIPYWSISLISFILFSASIYLIPKSHAAIKYAWLAFGYPTPFGLSTLLPQLVYTSGI